MSGELPLFLRTQRPLHLQEFTMAAYAFSVAEHRHVVQETSRLQSYAAAEAALQTAISKVGTTAYTGFINTNAINNSNFQSATGSNLGSFSATMSYPNQADWVIITTTGPI